MMKALPRRSLSTALFLTAPPRNKHGIGMTSLCKYCHTKVFAPSIWNYCRWLSGAERTSPERHRYPRFGMQGIFTTALALKKGRA